MPSSQVTFVGEKCGLGTRLRYTIFCDPSVFTKLMRMRVTVISRRLDTCSRRPLFALELLRWKWLRIKVITVCSFDLASAFIAQGFNYLLMPDFRWPEREESLL